MDKLAMKPVFEAITRFMQDSIGPHLRQNEHLLSFRDKLTLNKLFNCAGCSYLFPRK